MLVRWPIDFSVNVKNAKQKNLCKESKAKNYLFISFLVQINEDKDKDNNTNHTQRNRTKSKLKVKSRK